MLVGCLYKACEHGVRFQRFRFEFRVELAAEIPGMVRQFGNFDKIPVGGIAGELQAIAGYDFFILSIELVAVAMAFGNLLFTVYPECQGVRIQIAGISAQSHVAAHDIATQQFAQHVEHPVRSGRIKLGTVGVKPAYIAGELNDKAVHSQADAEKRNIIDARIPGSLEHPVEPPLAESAGNEDSVKIVELFVQHGVQQTLRFHPLEPHFQLMGQAPVVQGLIEALIGVLVLDIFAHDTDIYRVNRIADFQDHAFPEAQIRLFFRNIQKSDDGIVQTFTVQNQGNLINIVNIKRRNNNIFRNVAEQGDFSLQLFGKQPVGST